MGVDLVSLKQSVDTTLFKRLLQLRRLTALPYYRSNGGNGEIRGLERCDRMLLTPGESDDSLLAQENGQYLVASFKDLTVCGERPPPC